MAKKISTKAKPSERERYLIPDGCGPFVDAMLKAIRWGDDEDTSLVAHWITDAEEALAFLQGLPDDLTPNDFDYSESGVYGLDKLRKQGAREKKKAEVRRKQLNGNRASRTRRILAKMK